MEWKRSWNNKRVILNVSSGSRVRSTCIKLLSRVQKTCACGIFIFLGQFEGEIGASSAFLLPLHELMYLIMWFYMEKI